MNGLGNEIVVVDLRGAAQASTRRRRAHRRSQPASHFDQMMVLRSAQQAGRASSASTIPTARRPRPAATACAASAGSSPRRPGRKDVKFETKAGVLDVERRRHRPHHRRHGPAEVRLAGHSARRGVPRYARIELQIGPIDKPILHSPSVVNVGNPHAVFWVEDVNAYDLGRIGPMLENHPIFPERANISLAHVTSPSAITCAPGSAAPGLTKACGSAACAAAVCAARKGLDRPAGDRRRCRAGRSLIEWRPTITS